ncbi:MAG: TonB-dependent receptor [Ignavibacteriales bacterium]|nr:TonB-dependent receptor [Ignavibacteriales bacterium]
MLRNFAVSILLVLLCVSLATAQDGKMRGKIADKESGEALIGANVTLEGTSLGATSDVNGDFIILGVPPGVYTVKASYIGYSAVTISNIRVNSNLTTTQDFKLSSTAIQVSAVEIIADRPIVQRNTTNAVRINTQENIRNIPIRGIQNLLALEAGVVQQNGNLYVRGGRANEVAYFIDGANTTNPFLGAQTSGAMAVTSNQNVAIIQEALEEVQLQSGGFTAEFGGANSGIVRSQMRTGGSQFKISAQYQTDDFAKPGSKFLGTTAFGFRDAVLTAGGPIPGVNNARFFVAGQHNYQRNRNALFLKPFKFDNLVTDNLGSRPAGTPLPGPVEFKENYLYNNWTEANSVQGTVSYDMNPVKFRFTGSYSFNHAPNGNNWPNALAGYFNQGRVTMSETSTLFSQLRATHVLSPTTFYEIGIAYQSRFFRTFDPDFGDNWQAYPDSAANASVGYGAGFTSRYQGPAPYSTIYQFNFADPNSPANGYGKNKQTSVGATIDFTSQINSKWELKAGGRLETWTIRNFTVGNISALQTFLHGTNGNDPRAFTSDYERRIRSIQRGVMNFYGYDVDGNEINDGFDKPGKPVFASAYIQNKFEYQDLILNVGVRYEYMSPKGVRLTRDVYMNPPVDQALNVVDENSFVSQEPFNLLLPRLNFSIPVTDRTVFYAQYGKYAQFPSLGQIYRNNIVISNLVNPSSRLPYSLGGQLNNAPAFDVRPERSTQYAVGFRQSLTDNFAFDFSGFYRDTKDQLTVRRITNDQGVPLFVGLANEDFGTVKGMEVTLELRRSNRLAAKINYTLTDARGTGSDALSSRDAVTDNASARFPSFINPFDYNQTHRGTIMLDYRWEKGDGGPVFEGLGLNLLLTFNSGHPYTKIEEIKNLGQASAWTIGVNALGDSRFRNPVEPVNASTTPWVFNLDLNVSKMLYFGGFSAEVFVNVLNVLNTKNIVNVYPSTGTADDDGWLKTASASQYKAIPHYADFYKAINLDNRWGYAATTGGNDLYSTPRQIRFGLRLEY